MCTLYSVTSTIRLASSYHSFGALGPRRTYKYIEDGPGSLSYRAARMTAEILIYKSSCARLP